MLPLDSPRWHALEAAKGPASHFPGLLRQLREHPEDEGLWWGELWKALYHQGSTWSGSYAALPHVVEVARAHPGPVARRECVLVTGIIALDAPADVVPEEFRADYRTALVHARRLAREELMGATHDRTTYLYLLIALAGLSGWSQLGHQLEGLVRGELETECPKCGVPLVLLPEEAGVSISAEPNAALKPGARCLPVAPAPERTLPLDDGAGPLEQLLALSLHTGHSRAASWLRCLGGTASCPACAETFPVEDPGDSSR
ncbi:hypothetical protein HJC22_35240 [Corallococcus exiguus]|uniref:hypothetical protein n=1 Tax=Corallococcus exiguus TaxID=83462 RepID=UPI001471605D|nr:hypothetical protein [Corallococcus exiguus]NNC20980.1 hypothetical protein [Corallococcus exiguus]